MNRRWLLPSLLISTLLAIGWPVAARADCWGTDVGCATDAWVYGEQYKWAMSFWQINRGGLVMARWVEDLRVWLTDTLFVSLFTEIAKPVAFLFWVALIVAWMIFVISFMVQVLIQLNWVDLRRAVRPILLALVLFQFGGPLLQGTEHIRLMLSSVMINAVNTAIATNGLPGAPTVNTGDLPSMTTIYDDNPCSGMQLSRTPRAMELNDYTARYVWANAPDIHCPPTGMSLPSGFQDRYFHTTNLKAIDDGNVRAQQLQQAGMGINVQATALLLMGGAIIEQIMHLIFAVALGLSWFGMLFSLVVAVFLPTEAILSQQIQSIMSIFKASLLASILVGIGLAVMQAAAQAGNGALVLMSGLTLIAILLWQSRQAIGVLGTGIAAAGAALGGAPQAVSQMARGWASTAKTVAIGGAALAGMVATGGGVGMVAGQVLSQAVRRSARHAGDNPLAGAAARVFANRVASKIDQRVSDAQQQQQIANTEAEAAWYERLPAPDGFAQQRRQTLRAQAATMTAQQDDRQAQRLSDSAARRERSPLPWVQRSAEQRRKDADRFRRQADALRRGPAANEPTPNTAALPTIPLNTPVERPRLRVAARPTQFAQQQMRRLRNTTASTTPSGAPASDSAIGAEEFMASTTSGRPNRRMTRQERARRISTRRALALQTGAASSRGDGIVLPTLPASMPTPALSDAASPTEAGNGAAPRRWVMPRSGGRHGPDMAKLRADRWWMPQGAAVRMESGTIRPQWVRQATPPADALYVPQSEMAHDWSTLVMDGYTVQTQTDGRIAIWDDADRTSVGPWDSRPRTADPGVRHTALIQAGHLKPTVPAPAAAVAQPTPAITMPVQRPAGASPMAPSAQIQPVVAPPLHVPAPVQPQPSLPTTTIGTGNVPPVIVTAAPIPQIVPGTGTPVSVAAFRDDSSLPSANATVPSPVVSPLRAAAPPVASVPPLPTTVERVPPPPPVTAPHALPPSGSAIPQVIPAMGSLAAGGSGEPPSRTPTATVPLSTPQAVPGVRLPTVPPISVTPVAASQTVATAVPVTPTESTRPKRPWRTPVQPTPAAQNSEERS